MNAPQNRGNVVSLISCFPHYLYKFENTLLGKNAFVKELCEEIDNPENLGYLNLQQLQPFMEKTLGVFTSGSTRKDVLCDGIL